ncbi:Y+L amino acid transporter 2-like isoform X1 [Daphnia pulicaria]|uniref:Y+L amino acid transporter 2-like isoform X1 n=1 Tax=Daphnia pulicaria TaxID=35523 RepID=UPI001EEBD07F|nr:Y+L amino acid transporter 2-like isoform X1 [Daphnia pulicaria]XP_046640064.1 Y+L amino acid transporter 2-like isoform X1 [Daphnia pulicaria]
MEEKAGTKYAEVPQNEEHAAKDKDQPEGGAVRLQAKMSLINGVTVIVGSIIGSGIFISPTGVLVQTGSVNMALIVWIVSGIFSMIGAYCYAELGCMIKKSGADYAYIMETFGPFLAFIRLWVECMIVRPCSQAIVALTFSIYILTPMFPECSPPTESVRLLAAACICLLTFVNCWDVKWSTLVQDTFTYAKLVALFIIMGTGVYQLCTGHTEYFTFENTETDITKLSLAFYSGLFAYNGWNYLNFIIEELQDPVRNLPRAIAISLITVTVTYVFTNVAFYTTLSPLEVRGSTAVAVTFAERLYGPMAWIIPVFVAMSTFGAVNGVLLTSSRLFYAGACEGQMPEILTMIQVTRLTPTPAVLCIAMLSLIYLASDNVYSLINYVGFATWLSIGLAVVCIPYLRWKRPDLERPIRVNLFFPIIYIIATIFITVVPCIASPVDTGYGALIIFTGVPVYFVFIYWENKPHCIRKALVAFTVFMQKIMVVVGAEKPAQV